MTLFSFLWLFDILVALVAVGGFIFYLFRGPVSSAITGAWILLLSVLGITLLAAGWLQFKAYPTPALLLLLVMASPGLLYLVLSFALNVFKLKI